MRSISARSSVRGSRYSGMPKRIMPPGSDGGFEHRDVVVEQRQVVGGGHAGRTGADHGDAAAGPGAEAGAGAVEGQRQMARVAIALGDAGGEQLRLGVGPDRLHAELLGDVALERANRNRRIDAAAAARVFAGSGAHASAHRGERVGGARDQVGFFGPAVGDQLDVAAGVGRDRTAGLALDLGLPVREIRQLPCECPSTPLGAACPTPLSNPMTCLSRSGRTRLFPNATGVPRNSPGH